MNIKHYKNLLQTKVSQKTLWIIGGIAVALLIFQAGIFVGYKKASFSYGSGDNFHRMFGSPERGGMMGIDGMRGLSSREFTSGYGTTGTIVRIDLPNIIVAGKDKVEKVISMNEKTIIRFLRENIVPADLKVGYSIIVIGAPNTSSTQTEAKLIRVLPIPPTATTTEK